MKGVKFFLSMSLMICFLISSSFLVTGCSKKSSGSSVADKPKPDPDPDPDDPEGRVEPPLTKRYKVGDTLRFVLVLSEGTQVDLLNEQRRPFIPIEIGGVERQAYYTGGSGTTRLTFEYTIDSGLSGQVALTPKIHPNGGMIGGRSDTISFSELGLTAPDLSGISVTEDQSKPGVFLSNTYLAVDEDGGEDTYTVKLTKAPSSDVTIDLSSEDTSVVTVSPATLTFTPTNYNTAQTVTVTGVDNSIVNLPTQTVINHKVRPNDNNYNNFPDFSVLVVSNNDDSQAVPGFILSKNFIKVSEEGGKDTYTVRLNTAPSSDVTITLSSGDGTVATVSPTTLTFTPTNYSTVQTVTVTGVDDSNADKSDFHMNRVTLIDHTVTTGSYGNRFTVPVLSENNDRFILGGTNLNFSVSDGYKTKVNEGETITYTVRLSEEPASDVTINLSSGDTDTATVSPTTLTFTPTNYSTTQTVTVTGVDNKEGGDKETTITHSSTASGYSSLPSITVASVDNDTPKILLVPANDRMSVDEGETNTYEVKLSIAPESNVTITLTSGDESVATVSPATLTFTPTDYDTAQTVTVTGIEDSKDSDFGEQPNLTSQISHSSSDSTISNVNLDVSVNDNDTARVLFFIEKTAAFSDSPSESPLSLNEPSNQELHFKLTFEDTQVTLDGSLEMSLGLDKGAGVTNGDYCFKDRNDRTSGPSGPCSSNSSAEIDVTFNFSDNSPNNIYGRDRKVKKLIVIDDDFAEENEGLRFFVKKMTLKKTGEPDLVLIDKTTNPQVEKVDVDDFSVDFIDNDQRGLVVTPSKTILTTKEGSDPEQTEFKVALRSQPTGDVTVALGGQSDKFNTTSFPLTFTPENWDTAQTPVLNIVSANIPSGGEFQLTLQASGADYASVSETVRIQSASKCRDESDGDGSSLENPKHICSYGDLKTALQSTETKHYKLFYDIDASESWGEGDDDCEPFDGTNHREATCTGWDPGSNVFKGSFDGNNKKIMDLYIKRSTPLAIGLFGRADLSSAGIIKNLELQDPRIYATNDGTLEATGALVGRLTKGGVIDNCSVVSTSEEDPWILSVENEKPTSHTVSVGGLIGDAYSGSEFSIKNSFLTSAKITAKVTREATGTHNKTYVGGLVGRISGPDSGRQRNGLVVSSFSQGEIEILNPSSSSGDKNTHVHVGGLVGLLRNGDNYSTTIHTCYSRVGLSGEVQFAGGLVGKMEVGGKIQNSYVAYPDNFSEKDITADDNDKRNPTFWAGGWFRREYDDTNNNDKVFWDQTTWPDKYVYQDGDSAEGKLKKTDGTTDIDLFGEGLATSDMQSACTSETDGICSLKVKDADDADDAEKTGFEFSSGNYPKVKKCINDFSDPSSDLSDLSSLTFDPEVVGGQ